MMPEERRGCGCVLLLTAVFWIVVILAIGLWLRGHPL